MEKIMSEIRLCLICMEEHEVDTVRVIDTEIFKNEEVSFPALYEYCSNADEYLETEEMIRANSLAMKDAYRSKVSLLTSGKIVSIREKYGLSQKDFSEILGWGGATIARYENHQVQDRAHDDVLRKIDADPKWFVEMLKRAEERISTRAYKKYYEEAIRQYRKMHNKYLIDSIQAVYAKYGNVEETGGVELNLAKVVEMINYFADKVKSLYKVKLMKMLWYADFLHYKRERKSISGLVYCALPMGAVPDSYEQIVMLEGVSFNTNLYGETIAYRFYPSPDFEIKELTPHEIETMDKVIVELGDLNSDEIIERMHGEEAYKHTNANCVIPYSYAEKLSIS